MSEPRAIRSLHLTPDLLRYGGGPQMLKLLAEYSDPDVCRVSIASLSARRADSLTFSKPVAVEFLDAQTAPFPLKLQRVWRLVRRDRPDILHAYGNACSALATLVGLALKLPVVVWEIALDTYGSRRLPWLVDNLSEWVIRERVCNSYATMSTRQSRILLPRARWGVQCRGVPDRDVYREPLRGERRAEVRARLDLGAEDLAVMSIGGFISLRDHIGILRAVRELVTAGWSLAVFFAGDGPERRAVIREAEALGLASCVRFLGYVENAYELLPGMDFYVNNTFAEGFGIATVEAMLSGLPVVAADAGANSEVVEHGHTGLLVRPHDPHDLAKGIEALLKDRERASSLGLHAREASLRQFAPEALAHAHTDICRRLATCEDRR